jgi:hypothetical protein
LSREFVCVRLVKMNGVDLRQFQFDYDLTWCAFFLNADGTVYARYGSRTPEDSMGNNSVKGLLTTMRRVLEAHAGYPGNGPLFRAKLGPETRFARPEDIPSRRTRRTLGSITRASCIHCHNVHEAFHELERRDGSLLPERVYKYPLPETIGLTLDPDVGTRVSGVAAGSPAARAGIEAGDDLLALDGQAIFSLADVQFVLHHLPAETALKASLRRGDRTEERTVHLSGEWKKTDFSWRASLRELSPTSELYLHKLDAAEREALGIAAEKVALEVRAIFDPRLERYGLEKGDVIVGYDGRTEPLGAPRFHDYVRVHHLKPGAVLELDVLRGGARRKVELRL